MAERRCSGVSSGRALPPSEPTLVAVTKPEAMMFKRIDHVEIVTDQLDRTVQFYTEVLGFHRESQRPD